MTAPPAGDVTALVDAVRRALAVRDLSQAGLALAGASVERAANTLERLNPAQRAVAFRLLAKDHALAVFEDFSPRLQGDLIQSLQDAEVAAIFADLEPDDRVWVLDELPASLAPRLLSGLSERERQFTADVLGYPHGSIGRRMSPEYVSVHDNRTVDQAMIRVQSRLEDAETIYTLPVVDGSRRVVGVVSLRELMRAEPSALVVDHMRPALTATANESAETAARRCADQRLLALPVVDSESRLVGILTIDDAVRILEQEESQDVARQGGVEPLGRPYLAAPIMSLVSSRVVWLLVLAIGATLTVQVLSAFEDTLEQVTVLALFVPLLIGTGGNTGNQAATTVTRALALNDVQPRDLWRVLARELRVGLTLGLLLGALGGILTAIVFEPQVGVIIGLTMIAICTMAAAIGGVMPLLAGTIKADPAVFSNPFITTFVDAAGLVVYFLIAQAVLGL